MIVASRLSYKLDIGGVVLGGNYVGVAQTSDAAAGGQNALAAKAPGRERIAGFEITRDVPNDVWERWEARAAFERTGSVYGSEDEQALTEWCWRNVRAHGHAHGAPQGGTDGSPVAGPPSINAGMR